MCVYQIITLYILNLRMLYVINISIKLEGKKDGPGTPVKEKLRRKVDRKK